MWRSCSLFLLINNLLGAGNDVCDKLETNYPNEMENFYAENHLKKSGQGAGGKFNRPSIKHILKEENLCQLENMLPVSASAFISYLRSLRNLHELCVACMPYMPRGEGSKCPDRFLFAITNFFSR